ncbi:MAG: ribonuclease H family protein [Thermodesulfobacteriota bacterium]|nr:ribonuclease H family protein [Thermodesulfobacteriota bacterium]
MTYYAVGKGRKPGVYKSWGEAEKQVKGYKGAKCKKFENRQDAEDFVENPIYKTSKPKTTKKNIRKNDSIPEDAIIVYTDGCSLGNPGPGGYGVVIEGVGKKKKGYKLTTNNRMELMAVIVALKKLQAFEQPIVIHSDSRYVVDAINKRWVNRWKKAGWMVKDGSIRNNHDLWKKLLKLKKGLDVEFRWVKGHAGDPLNEMVDKLAKDAARGEELFEDKGYLAALRK